jgi:adenosine deaminase
MFSTTLNHEYAVAADLLGVGHAGVAELARAGVRASFLDDAGKSVILDEIDGYERRHAVAPAD